MDNKLLGGLMNSLAAGAVDETIRISLSLPASLLKISHHMCFVEAPENNLVAHLGRSTYHRLSDGALLRLVKLGVVQLLVKQPGLLPHLRLFRQFS